MLNSYSGILIRQLWHKKTYSLLNITGLAVGISASLLIFLLVRYELSVDKFHAKKDRIYRVVCTETFSNGIMEYDGCAPVQLPEALKSEFPQAERVAATWRAGAEQFTIPGGGTPKIYRADDVCYAEPTLFDMFDFPWLAGRPEAALKEPYTMAITRSVATAWFGRWQDAMDKTVLEGDRRTPFRITGILEDLPANTDVPLKVVLSYATFRIIQGKNMTDAANWDNFNTASQCFFLIGPNQHIQSMNAMLPGFVGRHFAPLFAASHVKDSCFFQPLAEIHFDTRIDRYGKAGWSYRELWSLGLIGVFLLAVACINFINLSTAQSLSRAKEVGVRKVLGSSRPQLMGRFMAETGLLAGVALLLGSFLAALAIPWLDQLLHKAISLRALVMPSTLLFLLATGLTVTLLAGVYPGMVLSRFNPAAAFKSNVSTNASGGQSLRRGLVVLQFAIAQLLIIGTLVVVHQARYFHDRPTGFDRKAITLLQLPRNPENRSKFAWFKNQVEQLRGVQSASLCDAPPSTGGWWSTYLSLGNNPHNEDFEIEHRYADSGYLRTFHIALITGRYPYPSDTVGETMLNETAAKRLGFRNPVEMVGQTIRLEGRPDKKIRVVGIVRDFNNRPLRERIMPLALFSAAENFGLLAVKLDPSAMEGTLDRLQASFAKAFPDQMFNASFFDDKVSGFYRAETVAARLFILFAGLAIFISCLGLYGLVSFMVAQKTKEVGIRKVLGASVKSIVYLFSREFTVLIGMAFLVAVPIGYYFMQGWLSGYYYHITISWGVFAAAIVLSVAVAWLTVGYKAIKAAHANPVKSLRTE